MLTLEDAQWNETVRSSVLHAYGVLDTPRESDFDDLAQIAATICGTPIGVVNFVDTTRQFFKAEVGLGVRETPLESSFCRQAILSDDTLVIPDMTRDPGPEISGQSLGDRCAEAALLCRSNPQIAGRSSDRYRLRARP
ncbi:hypothetical protein [uncultured Jannaschia sp.]|uniref:hypothetical protein n=1 Tax=uncultured Jannaschia sp. TaxID=293347 RepID=UPI0026253898|nr:hypothetical protein [uncultured Jannaschia sp.]